MGKNKSKKISYDFILLFLDANYITGIKNTLSDFLFYFPYLFTPKKSIHRQIVIL